MKQIYLAFICLAFSGCSSALKIRVDMLDREALRKFPEFRRLEAEQAYSKLKELKNNNAFSKFKFQLKKVVQEGIETLVKDNVITKNDAEIVKTNIQKRIDTTFSEIDKNVIASLFAFEKLNKESKPDEYLNAKILISSAVTPYFNLKQEIEKEVNQPISGLDSFYNETSKKVSMSEDDLLNDVLASSVVHSPYKFWRKVDVENDFSQVTYKGNQQKQKSAYSRTVVRTLLGNSDIAITMENKGHFTVKGVRLDAAKVAEATFKGLTQSIHFLAMTTGAPVKKADSETSILPELEELTTLKASLGATERSFNESVLTLTAVAMRQQVGLVGTDAEKKKAAIAIVKKEFEAFKDQFSTQSKP